jgi:hypothetical protein
MMQAWIGSLRVSGKWLIMRSAPSRSPQWLNERKPVFEMLKAKPYLP